MGPVPNWALKLLSLLSTTLAPKGCLTWKETQLARYMGSSQHLPSVIYKLYGSMDPAATQPVVLLRYAPICCPIIDHWFAIASFSMRGCLCRIYLRKNSIQEWTYSLYLFIVNVSQHLPFPTDLTDALFCFELSKFQETNSFVDSLWEAIMKSARKKARTARFFK